MVRRGSQALATAVLIVAAACNAPAPADRDSSGRDQTSGRPSSQPSTSVTPHAASSGECLRAQRAALPRLIRSWWAAGDNTYGGFGGVARNRWHRGVNRYLAATAGAGCPAVPREATAVVFTDPVFRGTLGHSTAPDPKLTDTDVHRIRGELQTLARTLDADRAVQQMAATPLTCAELRRAVRVTYDVRRIPSAGGFGEDLFLIVRIRNTTARAMGGSTWGRVQVSEVVPGTPRELAWGGSSADGIGAGPRSRSAGTVYGMNWNHLTVPEHATIEKIEVGAYLAYGWKYVILGGIGALSCTMPVRRR